MAVQSTYGKLAFNEDFLGIGATAAIADATAGTRYNDIGLIAISGQTDLDYTVDEPNGVISFTGAGGAADGIVLYSAPMRPDRNGTIWVEARFKNASATDWRQFVGFVSTLNQAEMVNPFTLSGTTLTANNAGEAVGFYTDAGATTDDFRFLSSTAGVADLTAAYSYTLDGQTVGTLGIRANATLTADSYCIARVEIDPDGTARGYFGHESMRNTTGLTLVATMKSGTLTTTSLYFPVCLQVATSTGDPLIEIDYFRGGGNRYWGALVA
jgi:hypothetical protein